MQQTMKIALGAVVFVLAIVLGAVFSRSAHSQDSAPPSAIPGRYQFSHDVDTQFIFDTQTAHLWYRVGVGPKALWHSEPLPKEPERR